MTTDHLKFLKPLAAKDVSTILRREKEYGSSWKKRGGSGAFFVSIRKVDRIEEQVKKHGWDIFKAALADPRPEGILDDLADLSCYLLLIRAEIEAQKLKKKS